jgi:Protein of unknown function (DUF3017)
VAHLRAVPDPDDDPVVGPPVDSSPDQGVDRDATPEVEPVDPAAAVAPGEDDAPAPYAGGTDDEVGERPRRYPSTIGGAFYLCILAAAATALVIATRDDWRLGVQVLGGALVAGALLRLVLANRDAGMLAVRNRFLDAALLVATGVALILLSTSIPDMPVT